MHKLVAAVWIAMLVGSELHADPPKVDLSKLPAPAAGKMDFVKDIQPILAKCASCHSGVVRGNFSGRRGGFGLKNRTMALQGGNNGVVIVPGKSAESRFIHAVAGIDPDISQMPKGTANKPLSQVEIAKLRAWIDQGLDWPAETVKETTVKSEHWSFQPIRRPEQPKVSNEAWVRNSIDAFILARLDKEKLTPSPEANRPTLIRRLSLDLLGLPPSPQEVDDFCKENRSDAYERLVDRLLASPHYGERWGRHWLDLARYADSDGYEADRPRPFAWRYRNWVIDTLNRDMPFDHFTLEQLAGDLLPQASVEQKIATGFHRNTLTNKEGGTDQEQFRVEACVDRVNTTAKVFLGLTVGCAQCHDHKYDPISQREYYQLFAFFNSDDERDIAAPLPGEEVPYKKAKADFDKKRTELTDAVAQHKKSLKPEQEKTDKKLAELNKALAEHDKKAPSLSSAPTLAVGKGRKTHVMIRGDFLRPGIEVQAGTLGVLAGQTNPAGRSVSTRLALARWLVDTENPLTRRVIANWVWHHYFGRGIVATLEDFGTQGEKPSHPELVDYLATEFSQQQWSLKKLHKLIVTSASYRQSSKMRPELASRDPNNILLARQSRLRLEAEIIRDCSLAASGLLTRTIGGPSVRPPQPAGISELTYAGSARWVESKGPDRYRRGLYTWFQRTSPYPMLTTFDAPDGVLSCVRREKSNTPLQALTLLNDRPFVEAARALARRVLTESKAQAEDKMLLMFRLCLARSPSPAETKVLTQYLGDVRDHMKGDAERASKLVGPDAIPGVSATEAAVWVTLARTLLNLDEFVMRE